MIGENYSTVTRIGPKYCFWASLLAHFLPFGHFRSLIGINFGYFWGHFLGHFVSFLITLLQPLLQSGAENNIRCHLSSFVSQKILRRSLLRLKSWTYGANVSLSHLLVWSTLRSLRCSNQGCVNFAQTGILELFL